MMNQDTLIESTPLAYYESTTRMRGQHIIQAGSALSFYPLTEPEDLLLINFDVHQFTHDGWYVLQRTNESGELTWIGCRLFYRSITQGALVLDSPNRPMIPFLESDWPTIIGRVEKTYRAYLPGAESARQGAAAHHNIATQ